MTAPENILFIRLKSIGDVLFTLPAVQLARANYPHARLTFLTSQENATLLAGFADLDEIITLDRQLYRRKNPIAIITGTLALLRKLRAEPFKQVFDFQGYGETAALAWLTRASQRHGPLDSKFRRRAYTDGLPRLHDRHPVDWNRELLTHAGLRPAPVRNQFVLPATAEAEARKFLAENQLTTARPLIYLQPFTSSATKNWSFEKYLALARHWRGRDAQIIFCGGPADKISLEPARVEGFTSAAGLPLLTAAGLMQLSRFIVGGDTGLLHLATALGRRVVMLMGGTGPSCCVPYGHAEWAMPARTETGVAGIELAAVISASEVAFAESAGI